MKVFLPSYFHAVDLIILTSKTVGPERQNYYFNKMGTHPY